MEAARIRIFQLYFIDINYIYSYVQRAGIAQSV
jgi:hypothetical protein